VLVAVMMVVVVKAAVRVITMVAVKVVLGLPLGHGVVGVSLEQEVEVWSVVVMVPAVMMPSMVVVMVAKESVMMVMMMVVSVGICAPFDDFNRVAEKFRTSLLIPGINCFPKNWRKMAISAQIFGQKKIHNIGLQEKIKFWPQFVCHVC
jgi:hypothetical protein